MDSTVNKTEYRSKRNLTDKPRWARQWFTIHKTKKEEHSDRELDSKSRVAGSSLTGDTSLCP